MKGRKRKSKKKKSKKEHVQDLSKKYNYLTADDINSQEAKHKLSLQTLRHFKDKFLLSSNLFKEDTKEHEDAYLHCEDFPQLDNPAEIRTFLSKWDYTEKEKIENYFNWILNVDERSVLTQDIDAPNLTREHLRKQEFGFVHDYCNHVNVLLKIFREMDTIGNIYDDMLQLHEQVMNGVQNTIDEFTFRIVRDAEAFMESLDSQTCNYFFDCLDFKLHIWAFKNVPLTITEDMMPKKAVDLHCLQVKISLPFAVLQENLVVRGLHLKYDHYSKSVATYHMPYAKEEADLEQLITEEHKTKTEMRNNISNQIINERKQREEAMREKQEKESKDKNKLKKGAKKVKAKKSNKKKVDKVENTEKPPVIGVEVFPDIESEFLEGQEEKHKLFLESISPAVFQLEEGEINLREYYLNGGIYEFNFVEKPRQVIYPNAILTELKEPAKLTIRYKNCSVKTINLGEIDIVDMNVAPEEATNMKTTKHDDPLRWNQIDKTEENAQIDNTVEPVLTFFIITIKIKPEISKWTEPVACQWYSGNSLQPTENEEENEEGPGSVEHEVVTPVVINDFVLSSNLERPLMYKIINYLIPRIPSTYRFPEEMQAASNKTPRLVIPESLDKRATEVHTTSVPERVFPYFKPLAPLVILPLTYTKIYDDEKTNNETLKKFSDYIKEFEEIEKLKQDKFTFASEKGDNVTVNEIEIDELELPSTISEKDNSAISTSTVKKKKKGLKKRKSKKKKNKKTPKKKASQSNNPLMIFKQKTCKWKLNTIAKIVSLLMDLYKRISKIKMEEEEEPDCKDSTNSINMECLDFNERPKWSTKNIFKSEFTAENNELKIWTNRLGLFALAFRRYTHLPLDTWTMMPERNKTIKFYAENGFAKFFIDITESGYTVEVHDLKLSKVRPVILHRIENPVKDIETFKETLRQFDLDIFPEEDAVVYIEKSCDKLLAMELHSYSCMATLSQWIQFNRSEWNRWADRRVIIVNCGVGDENLSDHDTVQITPEECRIVEIIEECTDLSRVVLSYKPTYKNIKHTPDLQSLAHSAFYHFQDAKTNNLKLQYNVMKLLRAIRPFSFCI